MRPIKIGSIYRLVSVIATGLFSLKIHWQVELDKGVGLESHSTGTITTPLKIHWQVEFDKGAGLESRSTGTITTDNNSLFFEMNALSSQTICCKRETKINLSCKVQLLLFKKYCLDSYLRFKNCTPIYTLLLTLNETKKTFPT